MNLEAWTTCLIHEEGLPTLIGYAFMLMIALILIASLAVALTRSYSSTGIPALGYGEFKLSGAPALVAFMAIAGVLVFFCYLFAGSVLAAYPASKVAFDSPEVSNTLDELRVAFRGETRSTIRLDALASQYPVKGHFEGRCVADFFDNICRAHSKDIRCDIRSSTRSISVSRP
jgi:hypothetical protein